MVNQQTNFNKDERVEKVYKLILKYTTFDFSARETVSEKGDELDAIIAGLNTLGEELQDSGTITRENEKRINNILEVLLKYTLMDFSQKAEVGDVGDEIDAIAVGLNTLSEELEALRTVEKKYIETIRESEERFRTLIESAKDYAIFMVDPNGLIATWNHGARHIKGYLEEEVIGKHISIFYTKDEIERGEPEYNLTKAKENGRIEIEGWRVRKDGSVFWADVIYTAIYDEQGRLRGFSKVTRDITERKKAEEKITQLNHQLEQNINQLEVVNKELEAFSYSVSHDLRAPLRAIHGYTKILSEEHINKSDDEAITMMNSIMGNAKRMGQLIDDLLAFSKMGKKEIQRRPIDMNGLVESVVSALKNTLPPFRTEIIIHSLQGVNADYNLVYQVFINLISNAIKYSGTKEKPIVEIGSKDENDEIIYFVQDNGIGFDMKYYDNLFEVFQRLHHAKEFEGTGVGLALVKRIVGKHGGKVWAKAESGEGATFFFSLNKNN